MNCIYCFNKQNRKERLKNVSKDGESKKISNNKIYEILVEFKKLGGQHVIFTGGEPTLNRKLIDILKNCRDIGLQQEIITNGILLNQIDLYQLVSYVDHINVSIDTLIEKEANELWGVNDSSDCYSQLIEGLKKLNEVIVHEEKRIIVSILPVVTAINVNSMGTLIREIKEIFDFEVYWKFTKYGEIGNEKIDLKLGISDAEYFKTLKKIYKEFYNSNDDEAEAFALNQNGQRSIKQYPVNVLCSPSYFITNTGKVFPCQGLEKNEYYIGDIFEKNLSELFYEESFSKVREKLLLCNYEECKDCELKYVCTERCSICQDKINKETCKSMVVRRMYYAIKGYR